MACSLAPFFFSRRAALRPQCRRRSVFSSAPSGRTPCSTQRHSATSSLRASATIPILRSRLLPPAKRRSYQRVSSLWGWKRSYAQASSIAMARMRRLPSLPMPSSRSLSPLLCGVGVSPANDPTCFPLRKSRQPNSSMP